ncbi:MAG: lytic transglycosylase domain-containing protein [Woeseiaceae bacterium]|nr:lytic transglycosylase domain-containing protein [Woeseiaceae bacterium]
MASLHKAATWRAALLAGLVLQWLLPAADATRPKLEEAWQDFSSNESTLHPAYTFPHATCFRVAALEYGLPESLLLAIARGESDFNPTARSRANAHGVMQILWPGTAKHLGIHRLSDLYEPCTNIDAGARYFKELLERYEGNVHLALAAYNYGPGRIARDGKNIPAGATWYSGYIYRHLDYVLGSRKAQPATGSNLYSAIGQSTLLTFSEPYRAAAFIERMEANADGLRLDWFRRGTGEFEVVMTYADREEFDRSVRLLARAGFRID